MYDVLMMCVGSIDKKIKGKEKGKKGLQEQALETPPPVSVMRSKLYLPNVEDISNISIRT